MPIAGTGLPLSITVDNGHDLSRPGDKRRYTVTVTNSGTVNLDDVVITQTVPVGLTYVAADGHGAHARQTVTWQLDLSAKRSTTVHTAMTVARTPPALPRLATVVCVRIPSAAEPVVCAVDSDLLPAGAAAEVAAARVDPTTWREVVSRAWPWFGGAGLASVVLGAVLVGRRRQPAGPIG